MYVGHSCICSLSSCWRLLSFKGIYLVYRAQMMWNEKTKTTKQYQADFSLNRKQRSLLFYFICVQYTKFWSLQVWATLMKKSISIWKGSAVRKKIMIGTTQWQRELPKKKIVLVNKTTTLHVQHSFLYEYGVKLPDFTFHGARKQAMTIFFSFWTWKLPLIQLPEGSPTFYKVSG